MNLNKYFSIILVLMLVVFNTSCSKYLDVNDDPNNPTVVKPEVILAVAQASVGGSVGGDLAIVGGLWSQHWTQSNVSSQYKTIDAYDIVPSSYNTTWNEMYAGGLNDLEVIKNGATANGNWNLFLQATVTQAYGYQILADFFDKIPYSEALKGVKNFNPKFDSGKDVYDGLIRAIDLALSKDFNASTVTYVNQDLVFPQGNKNDQIDSWKKFANTLKLKMYMRQTESATYKVAALASIKSMLTSGVKFLDEDAAITQFIDEPNRSNFLFENNVRQLNTGGNLRLSKTIQSYLEKNNDLARQNAYFVPGTTGGNPVQFGLVQGDYEANTTVTPGTKVSIVKMSALDKFYFISLDESLFLQAEAALRTGSDAKSLYDEAVTAAYAKFGLSVGTVIGTGGAYAYPSAGTTTQKLEMIMMQKWVAMFKQGCESFFDQVRTGIPKISPVSSTNAAYVPGQFTYALNGVTGGKFPKRLLFPSTSSDVNVNTPAVKPVTDGVWWTF